jgi:hypothetical protein
MSTALTKGRYPRSNCALLTPQKKKFKLKQKPLSNANTVVSTEPTFVTRSIYIRAAAAALALFASPAVAGAQQPPPASVTTPAENSPPAAGPKTDAPPQSDATVKSGSGAENKADKKLPWACKGLVQLACRKNKACTWIIPKEADKTGQVRSAYCHKLGTTTKKEKKSAAGKVTGITSPAPPSPEKKPPATSAPAP